MKTHKTAHKLYDNVRVWDGAAAAGAWAPRSLGFLGRPGPQEWSGWAAGGLEGPL